MTKTKSLLLLLLLSCISCQQGKVTGQEAVTIEKADSSQLIIRFDKFLYDWLKNPTGTETEQTLRNNKDFLDLYSNYILEVGSPDSASFSEKIQKYFSDSTLFKLYSDAENKYNSVQGIELQLKEAFDKFQSHFPLIKIPTVYMHVSGLNQSVIAGENILSVSIDKYLGKDYPLYQKYFHARQCRNMTEEKIVPDYLKGFMYSEFPMNSNNSRLLDNMIYEGKIIYALKTLLPDVSDAFLLGFSESELDVCLKNEKNMWRFILQNGHLYSNDYLTISKYMNDAPRSAFFTDEYPAQIGSFIGWRIVSRYMSENKKSTLSDLMNHNDAQKILTKAKYR